MKRIFLLLGSLWTLLRFSFLYFALSGEINPGGANATGFLLFTFGSAQAVMTLGFFLSGVQWNYFNSFRRLLIGGQIFAVFGDAAFLLFGTGAAGFSFSGLIGSLQFLQRLSVFTLAGGLTAIDFLIMICLILLKEVPVVESKADLSEQPEIVLPEVEEVSVEED